MRVRVLEQNFDSVRLIKMREKVLLICEECLSRNYNITIKTEEGRPTKMKKFCPRCGKHTFHKISK